MLLYLAVGALVIAPLAALFYNIPDMSGWAAAVRMMLAFGYAMLLSFVITWV
jgi:hypothetical protein